MLSLDTAAHWPRPGEGHPAHWHDRRRHRLYRRASRIRGSKGSASLGIPLYDALVRWDLSQGERLPDIVPGLAEVMGSG